ncbi:MAG: hypothetical protein JW984_01120 [Deltaproteobacteria bacterium]|uniref:Uncharacterized protein n=1 Tax=Candidatus Zymogenus saltonus TaxID=2844893 RepID=A0A9D8PKU9_9DELT|nr:hypothetical protein [Candidatus Zymogenus saltonus]
MKEIWRFKISSGDRISCAPALSRDRVFAVSDYHIWSLDLKHGFYYFREPLVSRTMRAVLPKKEGVKNFLYRDGLIYILLKDLFGRRHRIVFDPEKRSLVKGDTAPLVRKVVYIFKNRVRIERCMIDDRYREGVRAVDHTDNKFLWNSSDRIRPAIKYTEVVGDVLQAGEGIIIAQNYFSRRRKMPAGYSITSYHYRRGEVLWNMESFTYSSRLYSFATAGDFMYVTAGTAGGNKEGFFIKMNLKSGKIVEKIPFMGINSGVSGGVPGMESLFFLGAGDTVIAIEDKSD